MNPHLWSAITLAALSFAIYQVTTIGKAIMCQQEQVDALTAQVVKVGAEVQNVKAALADVQAQLDAAGVPAEVVDLSALTAAVQAVDDLNPDTPVPADVPVEEPTEPTE